MSSMIRIVTAWSFLLLCSPLFAVESTKAITVKTVDKPLFGTRLKPVRVRIGVDYQRFESILVKGKDGKAAYKSIPSSRVVHTLSSRLEHKNHFYFNDLHVETHPQMWDKESTKYKVRLDFYRTYGMHGELEEKLGSVMAHGVLKGEERRYNFIGENRAVFTDTKGLKRADIRVGTPRSIKKSMISKINNNKSNKK